MRTRAWAKVRQAARWPRSRIWSEFVRWEQHVTCGLPSGHGARGASLPHERNQTKVYPAHVFRVPGQISLQDFLLVEKAPQKHGHEGHDQAERPPRTERERHSDEEPNGAGVHRVTHVRVRPGVDDFLILLHANIGRGETVDPGHPEDE